MYTDALKVLLRFIYFTQTRLGKRHSSDHGWHPDGISHDITNSTDSSIIFICDMVSIFLLNLRVSFTENSCMFGTWLRYCPWGLHPLLHFHGNLWILLTVLPIAPVIVDHWSGIHSFPVSNLSLSDKARLYLIPFYQHNTCKSTHKAPPYRNVCLRSREWLFQETCMESSLWGRREQGWKEKHKAVIKPVCYCHSLL